MLWMWMDAVDGYMYILLHRTVVCSSALVDVDGSLSIVCYSVSQ